jgi:UDP-glucose 4-epimerase
VRASQEVCVDTAVVTGGAGFIGSHLAARLVRDGFRVRVIDNLSTGHRSNLAAIGEVEFVEGDVRDSALVERVVRGARWVFHEAAVVSVPLTIERPVESHEVNVTGTLNVFEAARLAGVERVVFAASAAAYGNVESLPKHEVDEPAPASPYAAHKLFGEHLCRVYSESMGVSAVALRYFNVFGPRQDPRGAYAAVISKFVERMARGERPTVLGDGHQTRDFVFVGDVVNANVLAATTGAAAGHVMNIGTGHSVSLLDLIAELNGVFGTKLEPEFGPPRAGDVRHSRASIERASRVIGYAPSVTLAAGLKALVDSLQEAA